MKTFKLYYNTVAFIALVLFAVSCKKPNNGEDIGGAGNTIVKLITDDDSYSLRAIDLVATPQKVNLLDIRRDVPNEGQLNQTMKVVVKQDPKILDDYNTEHGTSYEELPEGAYTVDAANPRDGASWTVTFAAGDFAKPLTIIVPNSLNLDLTKTYALGFTLTSVDANGKISEVPSQRKVVVEIGLKNKYDGAYKATGTMVDQTSSTLTGYYPWNLELRTSGANSVIVYDKENDYPLHPILSGTSWSYYGSFGLEVTFDPATNKVVSITNVFGQPSSNGRSAQLDPTGENMWDPSTKTIKIKYFMLQPGTSIRTKFDETWTYLGPR